MIAAGDLDRKITIQRIAITRDSIGGTVEGYVNLHVNVPARVEAYNGREKFHEHSDREISYRQRIFKIRYISGLLATDRIVYNGENWDIQRIDEPDRRATLRIFAQVAE
jgi:head-tail adaptor